MRVLYITTVPAPYKVQFFEELGKRCELTVIYELDEVSYREDGWMISRNENFRVVYLNGLKVKNKMISLGITGHLKKNTYDFVVFGVYSTVSQMAAQIYCKLKKIPYIISSDGGLIKNDSNISYKLKKYFIGSAQAWLSTGGATTEYLAHYGADTNKVYVYPFSSIRQADVLAKPISKEQKREIRSKLRIAEQKMILTVAQFIHRKGIDILLRSCENLDNNTGIYIVGGKPSEEYIRMKEELNLNNVHFVDFMKKEELSEYYQAADLFVLPTREDIWGLVVNEAMAHGLPVITTDRCVAGLEMISNEENGKIVRTNDVQQLKEAIRDLSNMVSDELMMTSLAVANEYTIEKMADAHFSIFEQMRRA